MSVQIFAPGTLPAGNNWPVPPSGDNSPSYSSIVAGGTSAVETPPPSPDWHCAIADHVGCTVESRSDKKRHVNELCLTAVGGEQEINLTGLTPIIYPASVYLHCGNPDQYTATDTANENYTSYLQSCQKGTFPTSSAISVNSGVVTLDVYQNGTLFAPMPEVGEVWMLGYMVDTIGTAGQAYPIPGLSARFVTMLTVTKTLVDAHDSVFHVTASINGGGVPDYAGPGTIAGGFGCRIVPMKVPLVSSGTGYLGLSVLDVTSITLSGSNMVFAYTLTSGPALRIGQWVKIVVSAVSDNTITNKNTGVFKIVGLGVGTFTVNNPQAVTCVAADWRALYSHFWGLSGEVDFLNGTIHMDLNSAAAPGTTFYLSYGSKGEDLTDAKIDWTNLADLAAGTGPAQCPMEYHTYDALYGGYLFGESKWLVFRKLGFSLPPGAIVRHISCNYEGSVAGGDVSSVKLENVALLSRNQIVSALTTQCVGDYELFGFNGEYGGMSWGEGIMAFPGSDLADDSHEFHSTDYDTWWGWNDAGASTFFPANTIPRGKIRYVNPSQVAAYQPDEAVTLGAGQPGGEMMPPSPYSSEDGLTSDDVNNDGFGFGISLGSQSSTTAIAKVYSARVAVYYDLSGTPPITPAVPVVMPPYSNKTALGDSNLYLISGRVSDSRGPAVAGASVYILEQPNSVNAIPSSLTPLANLYTGRDGGTALANPVVTDGYGFYRAYAASGQYTLVVLGNAGVQIYPDETVGIGNSLGFSGTLLTSPGAITIYEADGITPASIYLDCASNPMPNPSNTDPITGAYSFWAASGVYKVVSAGSLFTETVTIRASSVFKLENWTKNTLGHAIPGAQIWICSQPANTQKPIPPPRTAPSKVPWFPNPVAVAWANSAATVPVTFPLISNGLGYCEAYLLPGVYTVVVSYGGKVQQVFEDQEVG